jgi:hypothetical protein
MSTAAPPNSDGWLHEIRHDGHRLIAMVSKKQGRGRVALGEVMSTVSALGVL